MFRRLVILLSDGELRLTATGRARMSSAWAPSGVYRERCRLLAVGARWGVALAGQSLNGPVGAGVVLEALLGVSGGSLAGDLRRPIGRAGSAIHTSAPPLGALAACASPPCARAIAFTIERPRPVFGLVRPASARAKRSNARGRKSWEKPRPWSRTCSSTRSPVRPASRQTGPAPWRNALSTRLLSACVARWRSACTMSRSGGSA